MDPEKDSDEESDDDAYADEDPTTSDHEVGGVDVTRLNANGSDGTADVVQQPGRGYRSVVGTSSASSYRGSANVPSSAASSASTAATSARTIGGGSFAASSGRYGSPKMPPIENMRLNAAPSSDAGSSKKFAKPHIVKSNKVTMVRLPI